MKRKFRRLKRKVYKLPILHRTISIFGLILVTFFSVVAYTVASAPHYEAKVEKAHAKDAQIAFSVRGRGEPIILIPGFGMTMQHWDPLFIERLSAGHQVIMFDYRGVGESSGDVNTLSQPVMAEDVVTLMDQLKIDKADIAGWSMGSFIAQYVAQRYPDRVDNLVLLGTAPGGKAAVSASRDIREKVNKNLDGTWEDFYAPLMFNDQKKTKAYIERLEKAYEAHELPKGREESHDAKVAMQQALADQVDEKARYDNLPKIKAPTLVLSGEKDRLTPIANAKKVAMKIPDAKLVIVPDTGHAVMFEDVDGVTKEIQTFLREN